MPAEPTTWRAAPVCATEAMQAAGRDAIEPYVGRGLSRPVTDQWQIAREVYAAMVHAAPKPPAVSPWSPIERAPKDGTRIIFGGRWKPFDILPGGEWMTVIVSWSTTLSNATDKKWLSDGFDDPMRWNVNWTDWAPLPEPPATGDADHG